MGFLWKDINVNSFRKFELWSPDETIISFDHIKIALISVMVRLASSTIPYNEIIKGVMPLKKQMHLAPSFGSEGNLRVIRDLSE